MTEAHERLRTLLSDAVKSGDVGHDAALSVLKGIAAFAMDRSIGVSKAAGPPHSATENNLLGSSVAEFMAEAGISRKPRAPRAPVDPRRYRGVDQPGLAPVLWDRDAWDQDARARGLKTGRENLPTPTDDPEPT